jgi:hypothetical protein
MGSVRHQRRVEGYQRRDGQILTYFHCQEKHGYDKFSNLLLRIRIIIIELRVIIILRNPFTNINYLLCIDRVCWPQWIFNSARRLWLRTSLTHHCTKSDNPTWINNCRHVCIEVNSRIVGQTTRIR